MAAAPPLSSLSPSPPTYLATFWDLGVASGPWPRRWLHDPWRSEAGGSPAAVAASTAASDIGKRPGRGRLQYAALLAWDASAGMRYSPSCLGESGVQLLGSLAGGCRLGGVGLGLPQPGDRRRATGPGS